MPARSKPPSGAAPSLLAQLKWSNEQLAIFRAKAAPEEMRAEKLLAQHEHDVEKIERLTERLGVEVGKVMLRDEGIVQTVLPAIVADSCACPKPAISGA